MKKLFKEIFSAENLKRAMIYGALANPSINVSGAIQLAYELRKMDAKSVNNSINKEVNIKKAA